MKIIIGCDPDVDGKGFAIYDDGKLIELLSLSLIELYAVIEAALLTMDVELHIEDVNAISASSFKHKREMSQQVKNKVSESVGKCKQMQIEVEKVAEDFDIKIVRYRVSSKWKSQAGKKEFERVTGWTGRSNEDTRSAAYFGYLGCK